VDHRTGDLPGRRLFLGGDKSGRERSAIVFRITSARGRAIKKVGAQFVVLCRQMGLLTCVSVAINGSKFKAVNTRDKNFTRGKAERRRAQIDDSVARSLAQLDAADRQERSEALTAKTTHLKEELVKLQEEMAKLAAYEKQMLAVPDQQISLTDPVCRSMATSGRGSGVVGYNVQVAVDKEHHLIVTHEVTNSGSDRARLSNIATQAKDILGVDKLEAIADRDYFSGDQIHACDRAGIEVTLPKPMTSGIEAKGPIAAQVARQHCLWRPSRWLVLPIDGAEDGAPRKRLCEPRRSSRRLKIP
jgi:hypothetical protein